jgi:hypothetical protein
MPVEIRKWWIERTNKEVKRENGEKEESHVDPHGTVHNT